MSNAEHRALYNRLRTEWMYTILWPSERQVLWTWEGIIHYTRTEILPPREMLELIIDENPEEFRN